MERNALRNSLGGIASNNDSHDDGDDDDDDEDYWNWSARGIIDLAI